MDSDAEAEEIPSDDDGQVAENDDYSIEFEPETPAPVKKVVATATVAAVPESDDYDDDDFEKDEVDKDEVDKDSYQDASFENESRTSSPRHHVNLSVPIRPPSPQHTKEPVLLLEKTSPKRNVLEKIEEIPMSSGNQYIRRLENQLLQENEQLKHEHAIALRTASDLRNEIRFLTQRHVDEKRLRNERFQQKKKRADERRLQHELLLQSTKNSLTELEQKYIALDGNYAAKVQECQALMSKVEMIEKEKRMVEERQLLVSEKYQTCLNDLHALNAKLEAAVDARQHTQQKYEQAMVDHRVAIQVVEERCRVQLECMQETLQRTLAERDSEKVALPENYRLIVEAQRERYEKLEAAISQEKKDLEASFRRERERYEKSLAMANELRIQAEERADSRIRDEAMKIYRERDAIDEQRRQLLSGLAIQNARMDDERGKLEALRAQLEEKRLKLVQDEITVETQAKAYNERLLQLTRDEDVINRRKRELMDLSTATLEKSKNYSTLVRELEEKKAMLEELKAKYDKLVESSKQRGAENELKHEALEREKAALDRSVYQLHQEKLLVAKQRMEARQMLEGTRKLDYLLRQQATLNYQPIRPNCANIFQPPGPPTTLPYSKDCQIPKLAQFLATWEDLNPILPSQNSCYSEGYDASNPNTTLT